MIRNEVEKLRGMVFTPDELEDVILPLVADSKSKLYHKPSETKELVKRSRSQYYAWKSEYQKRIQLFGILKDMAENNPTKLISLWDKVLNTRELLFPKDIDEELFLAFDVGNVFLVYNDRYYVDYITDDKIVFKASGE